MASFFEKVYQLTALIPPGKVASYGQLAALLGEPRAARTVGWALHALPSGRTIPWHRVVNARGQISILRRKDSAALQRQLLETEGVIFGHDGRVNMAVFRWDGPTFAELDAIWPNL